MFGKKQKKIESLRATVEELQAVIGVYKSQETGIRAAEKRIHDAFSLLYSAVEDTKEFKENLTTQYDSMFLRWKEGMADLSTLKGMLEQVYEAAFEQKVRKRRK